MNANSVWVNNEYAYVMVVRRGVIPRHATRVKVHSLREVQRPYKTRKDTFATVSFPDQPERPGTEVNVRNLYDFWDSYMDERTAMYAEEERKEAERIKQREQREREYQEQLEAQRRARELRAAELLTIKAELARLLSIDENAIELNAHYENFVINARHLKFLES